MKLTILRLTTLSAQDRIDLAKIWPDEDIADGSANQGERAAFMQTCGFRAQADGWVK